LDVIVSRMLHLPKQYVHHSLPMLRKCNNL